MDEEVLRSNISSYEASLAHQSNLYNCLMCEEVLDSHTLHQLSSAMTLTNNCLQAEREKLAKLLDFNQQSSTAFSDLGLLEQSIQSGFSGISTSFGQHSSLGGFAIPSNMEWRKGITTAWEKREKVLNAYHVAVEKSESDNDLTRDDIEAIYAYAKMYPNESVSQKLLEAIKNFVDKSKEKYDETSTRLDVVANAIEQLGLGIQRLGGLLTILEGIKGPVTTNAQGVSTAFVVVNKGGIGQALVQQGSKVASIGKVAGYGLMGLGFGLGMYDDIVNKDKNWGQAFVHNGLSTGIGWGATEGASALIAFALGSNPVGWSAVGVATASFAVASLVFEAAYNNNFLGLQDGLDAVGDWLDDTGKILEMHSLRGLRM